MRQPVCKRKTFFFDAPHSSTVVCSLYAQSPYIWLKISHFSANNPFNLSKSREPPAGVSSTCSFGGAATPLKKKDTKHFISGIKCALILFQQSVTVCYVCVAVLSSDSALLSCSYRRCGLFTLHTNSFAHTRGSSTPPLLCFCFKRQVFCYGIDRDLFKMTTLVAWM